MKNDSIKKNVFFKISFFFFPLNMYAVIDTNIIIDREIEKFDFEKGFITQSILEEIKTDDLRQYLEIYMYKIEVKEPNEKYVEKVRQLQKEKNLLLSQADIDIVALTLEIKEYFIEKKFDEWLTKENIRNDVKCLTKDNGILNCLKILSQGSEGQSRDFMFRCGCCFTLFNEKLDFCKKCASNMISRVSVRRENGKIKVFLKKNFIYKKKIFKDKYGNILRSADQKEYMNHIKEINKIQK